MQEAGGRETEKKYSVCQPWCGFGVSEVNSEEGGKIKEQNGGRQRAAVSNQDGCRSGVNRPILRSD